MKYYYCYETEVGKMLFMEEDGYIIKITLINEITKDKKIGNDVVVEKETKLIELAYRQMQEYFNKKRKEFNFPIKLTGTEFQKRVWMELCNITYGQTRTYGEIAKLIGNSKAFRAVGMANHNNPIVIVVPCHRVIGSNNKLVGYAEGLDIKEKLLKLENEGK